jgi:hypothetical protein
MNSSSNLFVSIFFIQGTLATAILTWWFLNKKKPSLRWFGLGMLGYTLGLLAWTLVVVTKPTDLQPLILAGVIPFLLAHLAFAKAASYKYFKNTNTLVLITAALIIATFIARTLFYKSQPYFSSKGLLFFGLQPVPVALYIATISVSFLPAIRTVVSDMKNISLKSVMSVGFTIIYVNSIIQVSSKDDSLLLINGLVMSLALITLWIKALSTPAKI